MKTAICANVDEQELPWTQFGCFDFEDVIAFGDKLVLVNSDGIYEYGGGTDDGADIGAWFEIATTDFNVLNQKRLRAILGSALFSGDMIVSVKFDDGGFEGYHIVEDKDLDSYAFKRTINRAQKGCHVTIRFNNVAGSDFSVDAVDAIVLLLHNKPIGLGYEKASTAFLGNLKADIKLADGIVSVPGLFAHYDFSDASSLFTDAGVTNVVNDGDAIYQVNDLLGNENALVQSTADARPLYKTGVQNGNSIARFDGVDDFLKGAFTEKTQPYAIMVVAKVAAPTAANYIIGGYVDTAGVVITVSSSYRMTSGIALDGSIPVPSGFAIITALFNNASSVLSVDGVVDAEGASGSGTLKGITLGAHHFGSIISEVDICEVLAFSGIASHDDLVPTIDALKTKWGIS